MRIKLFILLQSRSQVSLRGGLAPNANFSITAKKAGNEVESLYPYFYGSSQGHAKGTFNIGANVHTDNHLRKSTK